MNQNDYDTKPSLLHTGDPMADKRHKIVKYICIMSIVGLGFSGLSYGLVGMWQAAFWLFGFSILYLYPLIKVSGGNSKGAVNALVPVYFFMVIMSCYLFGKYTYIHFAFVISILVAGIFYEKSKERNLLLVGSITGFAVCLAILGLTEPAFIHPYKDLLGGFNICMIIFAMGVVFNFYKSQMDLVRDNVYSSYKRYETIIDNATDAIIFADKNAAITEWNIKSKEMFGYTKSEALGQHWYDIMLPEKYRLPVKTETQKASVSRDSHFFRKRLSFSGLRKNGQKFPMDMSIYPIVHEGEIEYVAFLRDVTEQRKSQEKLIAVNQELQNFASVASHDMKEPLRTIGSFSDLLKRYVPETKETKEFLYYIKDAATRMTALLEDLISYARAGGKQDSLEAVNLNDIMHVVTNNLYQRLNETQGVIQFSNLPTIQAHKTPILQLFQNLVGNGIKYKKEDVAPVVKIRTKRVDKNWEIVIEDNGIGIQEQYLERIFEPFSRLHTRQEFEGSGIGLAICKKIVEQYEGRIWATSTYGNGTTITILIPVYALTSKDKAIPQGAMEEN